MRIFENKQVQYMSYREVFLATPLGRSVLMDIVANLPTAVAGDELTTMRFVREIVGRTGVFHEQNLEGLIGKLSELPIPQEGLKDGETQG